MRRAGRAQDESGAIAVLVALVSASLFMVAALVVDLGLARDTRRQSQNAADASALAAANALYPGAAACTTPVGATPPCLQDAVNAARSYASTNFSVTDADWSGCTDAGHYYVPPGSTPCISFADNAGVPSATRPTKVRVIIPTREVTTGFGVVAGVRRVEISAMARGVVDGGLSTSCGLCFLGPVDAINADFTVTGGSIEVNGDLDAGPNGVWSATGSIGVVGSVSGGQFPNGAPVTTDAFDDPWKDATNVPPAVTGDTKAAPACSTGSRKSETGNGPGRYGDFEIPNKPCTLDPGLYVITGAWTMKNNSDLIGNGVTLYFTCGSPASPHVCASGEAGGSLDAKNGLVHLSAPTTGATAGLAIVYDRQNIENLGLQGNGDTAITGAVYAPKSKLDFNGNSCFGFSHGPVIVTGVIQANGTKSCVKVSDSNDATIPPKPAEVALDQ
jgi:Flp pilus assembly protein TadG